MTHVKAAALVLAALPLFAACATPKAVTQITARNDKAKFVYAQTGFLSFKTGIVECTAAQDGELSACKEKPVFFKDP